MTVFGDAENFSVYVIGNLSSLLLAFNYVFRRCTYYFTPDLPGNKLTLDDLGLLLEELMDACGWWYDLGLQLNLSREILNTISPQFRSPIDFFLEMLKIWLTSSDNTSWKALLDALRSPTMEKNRLAGDLERKYCLTKEMRESKH